MSDSIPYQIAIHLHHLAMISFNKFEYCILNLTNYDALIVEIL